MSEQNRRRFPVLWFVGAACAALVIASIGLALRPSSTPTTTTTPTEQIILGPPGTPAGLVKPPAPQGTYVGSEACRECHAEIYDRYRETHGMAHSMATIADVEPIEAFEYASFNTPDGRTYKIERTDDEIRHHELGYDANGQPIYDQSYPVNYVLGSGRRGRAYVIERGDLLFQSPISWYSQKKKWGIAPGYAPGVHQRFDRRVSSSCLFCHAGTLAIKDLQRDTFQHPAIVEGFISCERCHGPGDKHVAMRRQGDVAETPDSSIVNPARLESARRDAVCYQCHFRGADSVLRYGRERFDYRPGELFEETWVAFTEKGEEASKTKSVSTVQQLRSSECFQQSAGKLGCITCHDPHSRPPLAERPQFYRNRCMQCHADHGCSLPADQQAAEPANGSCIHCHMPPTPTTDVPHTAMSDHRILRRPSDYPVESKEHGTLHHPVFFDEADKRLSPRDVQRAMGFIISESAAKTNDAARAREAIALLNPYGDQDIGFLTSIGDDTNVLHQLGLLYMICNQQDLGLLCWKRSLEIQPADEFVLNTLAIHYQSAGDANACLEVANKLVELNPYFPAFHWFRSNSYERLGRMDEAIAEAEKIVELDPTAVFVRRWLMEAYASRNQVVQGLEQKSFLDRLEQMKQSATKSTGTEP